jgi:hypothetical protein
MEEGRRSPPGPRKLSFGRRLQGGQQLIGLGALILPCASISGFVSFFVHSLRNGGN